MSHRFTPAGEAELRPGQRVQRWRHANGLTVLLLPDPSAPVVSYHTWIDVGSADEEPGRTGLAHLFEHLMFRETEDYPDGAFSDLLEATGSPDLNAWTWCDQTVFHVTVPSSELALVARLEATRMARLKLDEEQFRSELEVVLNERSYSIEDSPSGQLSEQVWKQAYQQHPYRWPTIGWRADLEALTLADVRAFYRRHYAPDRTLLVLVGDLEAGATLELLEQHYGALEPSGGTRRRRPPEPAQSQPRRTELELDISSPQLRLGWTVPPLGTAENVRFQLVEALLNWGAATPLQRRLIDTGQASSVSLGAPPFRDPVLWEISVALQEGRDPAEAQAIILETLSELACCVAPAALERARSQLLTRLWAGLESANGRADLLGLYEQQLGDWEQSLQSLTILEQTRPEEIAALVSRYLVPERMNVVVALPREASDVAPAPLESVPVEGATGPALRSRATAPLLPSQPLLRGREGGLQRLLLPRAETPLIGFHLAFPRGSAEDPDGLSGCAHLATEMLFRGTRQRDRIAYERLLEDTGCSLSAAVSHERTTFSGHVLRRHWPVLVDLLCESLSGPAMDPEELDRLRREVVASLRSRRDDDESLVQRHFRAALLPGHPYGREEQGEEETLGRLEPTHLEGWLSRHLVREGAVFGVYGGLDAEVERDLGRIGACLPERAGPRTPRPPLRTRRGRQVILVDKPGRTQVQILLGHRAPALGDPALPAFTTLNYAFGGPNFGTRLMEQIRTQRGWSYGAYSGFRLQREGGPWSISCFPQVADALPCLDLVLEMVEQLSAEGLSQAELDNAQQVLTRSRPFFQDTASRRLSLAVQQTVTGHDALAQLDLIEALRLEEVNRAAAQWIRPDDLLICLVGPADALREGLLQRPWLSETTLRTVPWTLSPEQALR